MAMLKAVLFDLFDTLLKVGRPDPEEALIQRFGLKLNYMEVSRVTCGVGADTKEQASLKMAQMLNLKESDATEIDKILDEQEAQVTAIDGAREALEHLKGEGFKLAVVSDNPFFNTKSILERFGMLRFLDAVLLSNKLCLLKPDERIYAKAFEELGVKPEEAVMVGDSYRRDIEPLIRMGAKAVHFAWKGNEDKNKGGAPIAKDFDEILALVNEIAQQENP